MAKREKAYLTIRIDQKLKEELSMASDIEKRSMSNISRLLLEFAFAEYHKAGSIRNLVSKQPELEFGRNRNG